MACQSSPFFAFQETSGLDLPASHLNSADRAAGQRQAGFCVSRVQRPRLVCSSSHHSPDAREGCSPCPPQQAMLPRTPGLGGGHQLFCPPPPSSARSSLRVLPGPVHLPSLCTPVPASRPPSPAAQASSSLHRPSALSFCCQAILPEADFQETQMGPVPPLVEAFLSGAPVWIPPLASTLSSHSGPAQTLPGWNHSWLPSWPSEVTRREFWHKGDSFISFGSLQKETDQ